MFFNKLYSPYHSSREHQTKDLTEGGVQGARGPVGLPRDSHTDTALTQTYTFSVLNFLSKKVFYTSYMN